MIKAMKGRYTYDSGMGVSLGEGWSELVNDSSDNVTSES